MNRRLAAICLSLALIIGGGSPALAGGFLETIDVTNAPPSPIAGHIIAKVIGIKWDTRCIPVMYKVNNTLDPIPNPLGPAFLSLADATAVLQDSLDEWNKIPASFIDMQIVGSVANPGLRGFDFINEITFRTAAGFNAIASSPSVSLIQDVTLVDGQDLDGDGDPDVSAAITVCQDVDGDGDMEIPAGFYRAGTILDNDVQFNTKVSNGFRFTIADADLDTVGRSVDLKCVAVHEFGHSFGLSHVLNNQKSAADGTGATMFPFIDTGDPDAELSGRTLDSDDIAFASFLYPEGTASSGPAAMQPGDMAFNKAYGLVTGELRHGIQDRPVAGGSLFAINRQTDEVIASAFSGTTRLSFNPVTGGLFFLPNPDDGIVDGKFTMPLPRGNYSIGVEPIDGQPAAAGNISFTAQIGAFYGQLNFVEEFFNNKSEGVLERRLGEARNVHVNPGQTSSGVNIVTARVLTLSPFGNRTNVGFINSPAGRMYAVQFPASEIEALLNTIDAPNPGHDAHLQAGLINTFVVNASTPALFARALLTRGVVNPDNSVTVNLGQPLESATGFLGQDNDFAPFYFKNPHELGRRVRREIQQGSLENLFLVLQIPTTTPFPGVAGQAPLVGLSSIAPLRGRSFISDNGGASWIRVNTFNFLFALVFSEPLQ